MARGVLTAPTAHSYPKPGKAVCGNGDEGHGAAAPFPSRPRFLLWTGRRHLEGRAAYCQIDSGIHTSLVTYFHSRAIRAHQFPLDQELTSSQKNAERLIAHSRITFFNWPNSELFIQGNLCATAIPSYHFLLF